MRNRHFLIIVLGILACMLMFDNLGLVTHDSNLIYAMGRHNGGDQGNPPPSSPAFPVPEPFTLLLLAAGLFGIGVYGRKKFLKK